MLACPQEIFFHNDTSLETQQMNYNGLINNPNVIASTNDFREREEQVWPSDVEEAFTEGKNLNHANNIFNHFSS